MAQLADIKKRMHSVAAIGKMTKAMQLISSVKMRRARRLFEQALPFFSHSLAGLLDLLAKYPHLTSPFFHNRDKKPGDAWHILIFVMTSDRGLAGTYNTDVVKAARILIADRSRAAEDRGLKAALDIRVMGRVGRELLLAEGYPVDPHYAFSINEPDYYEAADLSERILNRYADGLVDEVYMVYTEVLSPLVRRPIYTKLLPADPAGLQYLFADLKDLPAAKLSPEEVHFGEAENLDFEHLEDINLMLSYFYSTALSGLVYGALTEAYTGEQTARMSSMDSASKNSRQLLADLERSRNRLRQAQITTELTEIISGAESLKDKVKNGEG